MSQKCGYSNDQMQYAIDNKEQLILFVTHSADWQAFLILPPKQEPIDAAV